MKQDEQVEQMLDILKAQLQAKDKEINDLQEGLRRYRNLSYDLQNQFDQVINSNGWRVLSKYYRIRDKFHLPRVDQIFRKKKKIKVSNAITESNESSDLKVSIIIPVYNNTTYLYKCIQSALDQTYKHTEVVIVDDCSTDPAVIKILESFSEYDNFKYARNDFNSGISYTMNHAMALASGHWIAFLDCDDWLEPNAIEETVNSINKKAGAVYAYTDRYNFIEAEDRKVIESFRNRPQKNYFEELLIGMYTSHLKVIKKEVFLKIGLHESRFDGAQDYDIALKTAFHFGDAFVYVPHALYNHRIHLKQTTIEQAQKIENIVTTIRREAFLRRDIRAGKLETLISFLILSFEKKEMTLKCIQHIQNTVNIPYEIIVFDNASSSETVAYLKDYVEAIPNVKVIYSELNLGCPGGRREVTKYASGDYIINLDNDILVRDGWIEELIVRAESDKDIGAVCCKTIFPNGKIQFNGGTYTIQDGFISFMLTDGEKDENSIETADWHQCDWVPGGATLFKRKIIDRLDYSPGYINAFEDNDIAMQITNMQAKLVNCPSAQVTHYHIMQDEQQKQTEKNYMKVRYQSEGFVTSLVHFYKRNNLIINDMFIFRLMNLTGMDKEEVRKKITSLAQE